MALEWIENAHKRLLPVQPAPLLLPLRNSGGCAAALGHGFLRLLPEFAANVLCSASPGLVTCDHVTVVELSSLCHPYAQTIASLIGLAKKSPYQRVTPETSMSNISWQRCFPLNGSLGVASPNLLVICEECKASQ